MRRQFAPALAAMLALSAACAAPEDLCGGISPTNPNPDSSTDTQPDGGTATPCIAAWVPILLGETCRL